MRVGLSAYLLHEGRDYRSAGVSRYVHELLRHLATGRSGHNYVAFLGRDAPELTGVRLVRSMLPTQKPIVRILWEQLALPVEVRKHEVDVLHGTVNVLPLLTARPSVVTVHDLAFLLHPDRFPASKARYLKVAVSLSCQRATRVIAVSQHTKRDLVEVLGVPARKVSVVYSGVDESFRRLPAQELEEFRGSVLGGRRYVLHVGTLEPRKNLDVLIAAFDRLRKVMQSDHVLALVGPKGWMVDNLEKQVRDLQLTEDVRFVDFVDPAELPLWYNCADLFVYPSQYEGFGLPVLEAMACGCPVVTSSSGGMEELAGDACVTVEPGSQEALEEAMKRVLEDAGLSESLRQDGLERSRQFNWTRTASQTASVYEEARLEQAP